MISVYRDTPIEAFGEVRPLHQWYWDDRCKVVPATLRRRLRIGWEPEEAISTPVGAKKTGKRGLTIELFGEEKSVTEWANDPRCDVRPSTILSRIRDLGWTDEQAVLTPKNSGRPPQYFEAFGQRKTVSEWAKDPRCVVSHALLKKRIWVFHWGAEESMITPPRTPTAPVPEPVVPTLAPEPTVPKKAKKRERLYFAFGVWKTFDEWADDDRCIVKATVLERRIRSGVPMQDALPFRVKSRDRQAS